MTATITLQQIRDARPCADGWEKLLRYLGGNPPMDTTITLGDIAASNGVADALWAARCLPESERRNIVQCVLLAVKRASKHTPDQRVRDCIAAVERWVDGDDTVDLAAVAAEMRPALATAVLEARAEERAQQVADIISIYPQTR